MLDVVIGKLEVNSSGDAARSDTTAKRVELEAVAKSVESTTGCTHNVAEGSLDAVCIARMHALLVVVRFSMVWFCLRS